MTEKNRLNGKNVPGQNVRQIYILCTSKTAIPWKATATPILLNLHWVRRGIQVWLMQVSKPPAEGCSTLRVKWSLKAQVLEEGHRKTPRRLHWVFRGDAGSLWSPGSFRAAAKGWECLTVSRLSSWILLKWLASSGLL